MAYSYHSLTHCICPAHCLSAALSTQVNQPLPLLHLLSGLLCRPLLLPSPAPPTLVLLRLRGLALRLLNAPASAASLTLGDALRPSLLGL
jgi:XapX domain-containing protein